MRTSTKTRTLPETENMIIDVTSMGRTHVHLSERLPEYHKSSWFSGDTEGVVLSVGGTAIAQPKTINAHMQQIAELMRQRQDDGDRISALEKEVARLSGYIEGEVERAPNPRKLSIEDITKEVRSYFAEHDGEDIYPDDIAENLNLDLMKVIDACEALATEGRIARKEG